MKYFVPDSVAAEVHEREIPDQMVAGLPLAQAVAIIAAYDGYNVAGDDVFELPLERTYTEGNSVGVLEVETDGRGHFYGIVVSLTDLEAAAQQAKDLLNKWASDESELALLEPTMKFVATFEPQAWVDDYAIDVDPEGETTWDCTTAIKKYLGTDGKPAKPFKKQYGGVETWIDNDDVLKNDPAAPEWVRQWTGPFVITVERTT